MKAEEVHPSSLTIDEVVGINIRQLRLRAGLSQMELATLLNVIHVGTWSNQRVSVRELGKTPTTIAEACAIAYVIGVPLTQILVPFENDDLRSIFLGLIEVPAATFVLDLITDPPGRWLMGSSSGNLSTRKRRAFDDVYDQTVADVDRVDPTLEPDGQQTPGEWDWPADRDK